MLNYTNWLSSSFCIYGGMLYLSTHDPYFVQKVCFVGPILVNEIIGYKGVVLTIGLDVILFAYRKKKKKRSQITIRRR